MKQDYSAAGEQDDAHKIPQTAQQSVSAPTSRPLSNASYVNLYASARHWYRLNTPITAGHIFLNALKL